jgi:hypothetical protein
VAVVVDPHGRAWSVHRDWWPFWLLTKFLGARWVVVVERDGHEVGRELVRGGSKAKGRVNQIAYE